MDITDRVSPSSISRPPSLFADAWEGLRELGRYRELARHMTVASLKTENTGTLFGYLWWLLDPLLLMAVYVLIVGIILQRGGENYPLFVLTALISWKWFGSSVQTAIGQTVGRERLIKQVAFPKAVIPLASVAGGTFHFGFGLLVLVAMAAAFGIYPHPALLLLPVVAVVQLGLTLGIAFLFAALNVFFRDLRNLTIYAFRMWFYLSPGLYDASLIPERYQGLYHLNPFATLFPAYRSIVLDHAMPDWQALMVVGLASLVALVVGYVVFVRLEPYFAKVL